MEWEKKIIIHNKEEEKEVLTILENEGFTWLSGKLPTSVSFLVYPHCISVYSDNTISHTGNIVEAKDIIKRYGEQFEEGDKVVLAQNGMAYPYYAQFFEDNKVGRITSARYAYGDVPRKGTEGIVVGIYPDDENELALIRVGRYVYLIDVRGLEKV